MGPAPGFQRGGQRPIAEADTRRWIVVLVVLIGSLVVYGAEHWQQSPDAPIVGNAYVADGDTLTISGIRIRLVDIDAPELAQTCTDRPRPRMAVRTSGIGCTSFARSWTRRDVPIALT